MVSRNSDLKHLFLRVAFLTLIWLHRVLVEAVLEIPLLVKNKHSIQLLTVDSHAKNVSKAQPAIITSIDDNFPVSITFDVKSKTIIYIEGWSKTMHDRIQFHTPSSHSSQIQHSEFRRKSGVSEEVVTTLAFDWITYKVYIGVERTANVRSLGKIEVCSITDFLLELNVQNKSPICGVLLHRELDSLHSLVLDPIDGYMYWLSRIHRRIEKAWMNGEHHDRHPFHEFSENSKQIALTNGLTLDTTRRALFFIRTYSATGSSTHAHSSEVVMCKLYDRTSCSVVVSNVEAFDLDVFGNFLLWTTISAGNLRGTQTSTNLQMCQLNACSKQKIFSVENTSLVEFIRVFDSSKQPQRLNPNPCAEDNGKCSHLCLIIPGAPWRSCACPIGVKLQEDGLKCGRVGIQNLLLVGAAGGLYSISLDTHDYIPQPIIISSTVNSERNREYLEGSLSTVNGMQKYADIDFDPVDAKIYWVDKDARAIKRCLLNGSEYEELATKNLSGELNEIAVDWLGKNLVWIMDSQIELMKLGDSTSSIRLSIDHLNGRIYFANFYANQPKIESILMDGSDRKVLLLLSKYSWLSAIELDVAEDCIYWSDTAKFTINKARLSDGYRMGVVARDLKTTYSITKLGSTIFCNSLGGRSLTAIPLISKNKSDVFPLINASKQFEIAESEIYGQMSLKAVRPKDSSLIYKSLCAQDNGACQHICVQLGSTSRKCLCSMGYELQEDLLSCKIPAQFLIFSSTNITNDLMRASITFSNNNLQPMHLLNVTSSPGALAVDSSQGFVYWSGENSLEMEGSYHEHSAMGYIARANFDGTGVEVVYRSCTLRQICGLAVDAESTGNIFVCNGWLKRIEVIPPNGYLRRAVLWQQKDLTNPKFLVINSSNQSVFFVNFHNQKWRIGQTALTADIMGASIYGREAYKVVENAGRVTSLTLDPHSNRLFWSTVEGDIGYVYSLDGSEKTTLLSQSEVLLPTSMTFYKNQLYIANGKENGSIEVLAEDGHLVSIYSNIKNVINNIVMAHRISEDEFRGDTRNKCGIFPNARGKNPLKKYFQLQQCFCQQQPSALTTRGCLCSDQHHFVEALQKCVATSNFVLLGVGNHLIRYVIKKKQDSNHFDFGAEPFTILPYENVGWVVGGSLAVDWLSVQQYIYWLSTTEVSQQSQLQLKRVSGLTSDRHAKVLALAIEHNCTHLFDIALDVEGRQLFVSCSHARQQPHPNNHHHHYGHIHVWRIKSDDHLTYIGQIIGGARKSEATNLPAYPKQLVVFSEINALFYMDHNRQLDSPTIVQCQLSGQHCFVLVSTGFSFQYQPILLTKSTHYASRSQLNRLIYTTTTGVWSRRIEEFPSSKMQDILHHLIVDSNRAVIKGIVALEGSVEDDLSIYVLTNLNGVLKTSILEMENAVIDAPHYVDQLLEANWSASMLQIMNSRATAAAALLLDDGAEETPMRLLASAEEEALVTRGHSHSLRKHHRKEQATSSGCVHSPCSHICRTKILDSRKKIGKFFKTNDASYYDEEEEQSHAKKTSGTHWNARMELAFECLCPLGFSMTDNDAHQCEPNIHCASWEFACQDGKNCIHSAKRCNSLPDCPDESDETSFMCTFPTNPFQESVPSKEAKIFHKETLPNIAKDWSKTWVCDDGKTAIQKYLLCDGNFDCADHSDEFHCRCHNPRDYFDCTAWEHDPNFGKANTEISENGADCILRAMLCDGREHCRYGTDERTQLCKFLPPSSPFSFDTLVVLFQNGYVIAAALFVLFLILAIPLYCLRYLCWRNNAKRIHKDDSLTPNDTLHPTSSTAAISQTLLSTMATPHHLNPNASSAYVRSSATKGTINTQEAPSTTTGYCYYNSLPWQKDIQTVSGYQSLKHTSLSPQQEYLVATTATQAQPAVMMLSTCQSCSSPTSIFIGQSLGKESQHQHFVQYYDIGGPTGPQSTCSIVLPAPYCQPLIRAEMAQEMTFGHAPPPSAASLSTYGVVQPVGMPIAHRGHCAESTSSGISNVIRRPPLASSTPKHNASLASNNNKKRKRQRRTHERSREEEEVELVNYMPPPAYSQMLGQRRQELNKNSRKPKESINPPHLAAGPSKQAKMSKSESDSSSVSLDQRRRSVPSSNTTSSQENN